MGQDLTAWLLQQSQGRMMYSTVKFPIHFPFSLSTAPQTIHDRRCFLFCTYYISAWICYRYRRVRLFYYIWYFYLGASISAKKCARSHTQNVNKRKHYVFMRTTFYFVVFQTYHIISSVTSVNLLHASHSISHNRKLNTWTLSNAYKIHIYAYIMRIWNTKR